jgi:hypothetical protein
MADPDRRTRPIALPIGPNGSSVNGTLLINKNGDAEWFQGTGLGQQQTPTFTSNRSKGYTWQPSPNCVDGVTCPTSDLKTRFYSNTVSTTNLNNARLETFRSSTGFNSPDLAKQINVPGSNTAQNPDDAAIPTPPGDTPLPPIESLTPDLGEVPVPKDDPAYSDTEKAKKGGGNIAIVYPVGMRDEQDRIVFERWTYNPKKLSNDTEPWPYTGTLLSTIQLPIPSGISDTSSVEWGGANMNPIEIVATKQAFNIMDTDKTKDLMTAGNEATNQAKAVFRDTGDMWKYYFAQEAVGVQGLLSRASGSVLNSNLSLLFNGPSLRPFSFTFKLSPRDANESVIVRRIIRQFKEGSAVNTSAQNFFLKAPNVFKIRYEQKGGASKSLNQFKTCALTTVSVNYTPDGTYMTYEDGTMTSYEINLAFNELEPIYQKNYSKLAADDIGY